MKTIYFEKDIPRILATKFAAKHCKGMLYGGLNAVKFKTNLPDPPLPAGDWVRGKNIACGLLRSSPPLPLMYWFATDVIASIFPFFAASIS